MHKKIVDISLRYRFLVLMGTIAIAILGIYDYIELPVDAFPDISPIMVPVFVEADGMAPEEIERLITFPIESTMNGLPGVTQIKSTSAFGMAVIYVYFKDDIDIVSAAVEESGDNVTLSVTFQGTPVIDGTHLYWAWISFETGGEEGAGGGYGRTRLWADHHSLRLRTSA